MSERDLNLDRQNASIKNNTVESADFDSDRLWFEPESDGKAALEAKAEQIVERGLKAERSGNLKQAIACYRAALEQAPGSHQARQHLTTAIMKLRHQNRYEVMIQEKNSVSPRPSKAVNSSFGADTNTNSGGLSLFGGTNRAVGLQSNSNFTNVGLIHSPGNGSGSIELASPQSSQLVWQSDSAAPSIPPEKILAAEVYLSQATDYFEQQHWSQSIAACQEAIRVNPNAGEAYKIWGNCLQRSGRLSEAIGLYAKALETKADTAEIYSNLASIYAKQKKWQRAIEHYQKSIAIEPNNHVPYRNLARVWDELEEYEKSAQCFFKAIELKPDLLSALNHFDLANNLMSEGDVKQAISCYQNCIELDRKFLNAYARLGDALEQDGRSEEALFYYKKLAQLQTEGDSAGLKSKSLLQISALLKPAPRRPALAPAQGQRSRPAMSGSSTILPQLQPAKEVRQIEPASQPSQRQQAAAIHGKNGDLCLQKQQWQAAIAHYRQAIQLAPQQVSYHLKLGQAWTGIENYARANLAFFTGFGISPQKIPPQDHYLLGEKLLKQNESGKAIACYRRALGIQPNLIEAYWRLGEIATTKSDYKTALAYYRRALKIDPNRTQSYILLGKLLSQQGNWQGAQAYYQKAATIEPKSPELCCYRGEALINLQRSAEAEQLLRQAIELDPQYFKAYYQLGNLLSQQQQWQSAVEAYETAIALSHNSSCGGAYYGLGQAYLELQQWQPAASAFKHAVESNPASAWAHYGLGSALCELQQWQSAGTALEKSLELNPNFDWGYHKLGNAKYEVGDWDGAVNAYRRALEITPGLPKTETKLNDALRNRSMSDLKSVNHYYQSSLEAEPDNESAYFKALEVTPKDPKIYAKLAGLYRDRGDLKQASAFYKILLQIQPENREAAVAIAEIQSQA